MPGTIRAPGTIRLGRAVSCACHQAPPHNRHVPVAAQPSLADLQRRSARWRKSPRNICALAEIRCVLCVQGIDLLQSGAWAGRRAWLGDVVAAVLGRRRA